MAEQNRQQTARQDTGKASPPATNSLVPPVDIYEDKDGVVLFADLPGVGKDGLDVHIDKDTLQITGKRTVQAAKKADAAYTEVAEKDYYRAFTIGEEIDREKISAHLTNGVLKVVLPKAERVKPKKIEIKFS